MLDAEPAIACVERNLAGLRDRLAAAAGRAGRRAEDVALVAVTKYVGSGPVRLLHGLGLRDFGESTVQGLQAKREELRDLEGARWHMIGHLQRNKVPRALELAASIHSVDSVRLAHEISVQARRRGLAAPGLYVEVNWAREPRKSGLPPESVPEVLEVLLAEGLPVLGLMAMAPHAGDPEASRSIFRGVRALRDDLAARELLPPGAGLSMGMSADFAVAIEEGATVIRVGSSLFEGLPEAEGA
ncbi:MAG: YggS family pyridoxal phosphate-dependent enzyme [Planctomycetes bacterium]|nr:YggS family pyridoxal phosphate-dependent enzyme [Planctomycetota bacterium]